MNKKEKEKFLTEPQTNVPRLFVGIFGKWRGGLKRRIPGHPVVPRRFIETYPQKRSKQKCRSCGGYMLVSVGQIAYTHKDCRHNHRRI